MERHAFDMEAAIDVQDFAGHGTCVIAGEQQGRPAHFRRLDGASKRGRNRGCVQKLVEMLDAGRRAGGDRPCRDCVDADPLGAELVS